MRLVRENIEFKRGAKNIHKTLNVGMSRIPGIGDPVLVEMGRKEYFEGPGIRSGQVGPDEGIVEMKVASTPNFYEETIGSKGNILMPKNWSCYAQYKGEDHIIMYAPDWHPRWFLTGPRQHNFPEWKNSRLLHYSKSLKENIEFKRGGKQSITSKLGVGMYYPPYDLQTIYALKDGQYLGFGNTQRAVITKSGPEFFMHTYWTNSGPAFWPQEGVLRKENIIDLKIKEWFNENIDRLIPLRRPLLALIQEIGKPISKCSWQEIIEVNEAG